MDGMGRSARGRNLLTEVSKPVRSTHLWSCLTLLLLGTGCAKPAGVIFPPVDPPLAWPEAPDEARIRYVGQLATSADLKPGQSGVQGFGRALFGKREIHSMLAPFALCTD